MSESPAAPPELGSMAKVILDAADTMVVLTDLSGTIKYVNPAFTAVTGYAAEEAIGGTPRLLRSGMQGREFYEELWTTVLGGTTWHGELVNRRKDGTLYTDEMTVVPLSGPDGRPSHFVAIKRDVSTRVQSLTAASPVGIAHMGPDGRLLYVNRHTEDLLGAGFEKLIGSGWLDQLDATDRTLVLADIRSAYDNDPAEDAIGRRILLPSGRWIQFRAAPLVAEDASRLGVVLALTDVTVETFATAAVAERERFTREILDSMADATAVVDPNGLITAVNAPWSRFIADRGGDPDRSGVGADYRDVCATIATDGTSGMPADAGVHLLHEGLERILRGAEATFQHEFRCGSAGKERWLMARITPLRDSGGAVLAHTDVTWRKVAEERLAYAATFDALTGLLNRRAGHDRLEEELGAGSKGDTCLSVLFIDLDGFKGVNDTSGHAAGDAVLSAAARRIQGSVRAEDATVRMGGDEFLVILAGIGGGHELERTVARIEGSVGAPYRINDETVRIGASVGTATWTPGDTADSLVARADAAMYVAKQLRHQTAPRRGDPPILQLGSPD